VNIQGCGKLADTKYVIHSPGHNPKLLGNTVRPQNICGTHFETIIPGDRGIRLCERCTLRYGLRW